MNRKRSVLENSAVQSVLAAVLCILSGLLIGYIVLLIINPKGAGDAIITMVKNFMEYPTRPPRMKALGNTLVKTAPLLMCALSINFCYKTGLFNIGAAGQYVAGAAACLYGALGLHLPWYVCLAMAGAAGALWGCAVGLLKAYANVNEVISGIMLNWIGLYLANMLLQNVKESTSTYTLHVSKAGRNSLLPSAGLNALFTNNRYVTIAIPLAAVFAVVIWIVLGRTKFGYEIRATGYNRDAARYAGMNEKKNIILTLVIGGALAGIGAAFLYLSDYEQWSVTQSSVPAMGFNGIAATFLGGLSPIGTIFASYFIQHITSGGSLINKSMYPSQIADLVTAIIIYLCGFVMFFRTSMNLRLERRRSRPACENDREGGGAS